ncbi:hypothetical protein [Tenacibaculum piscium]|uniref:hypothetical protein n=1 Tax=Tenacibaculum piscium TaxID=1458515 RepID=UPI001F384414|nr:hypothetical protein [Tenacibaculum piscium]
MNENELLSFIEKLYSKLSKDRFVTQTEIGKLDKSKNVDLIRDKLVELNLLKDSGEIYDELTERGKNLKEFKTFKKLEKFEKPKKEYWLSMYQVISILLVIIFGLFGVYKYFDNKELKSQYENVKYDFEILNKKYDSVTTEKLELPEQKPNDSL